jgi:hypothetical protein
MSRAIFHQEHTERAASEAARLWAARKSKGSRWLPWIATELYSLGPPEYVSMVRRELERLANETS